MSSRPKPVKGSNPGLEMSWPERRMTSKSCVMSSVGRTVHTQAVAPATIGEAKLVPLKEAYLLGGLYVAGTATGIWYPGAARSTYCEPLVKNVGCPDWSMAPAVRTWGRLAGYSNGLPSSRLFPAAATTRVPDAKLTAT